MYKYHPNHQTSFIDFNQSCGLQLDPKNEWIRVATLIPWEELETVYAENFPSSKGRPAKPFRMALGLLIIQKRKNLSDRNLVKEVSENPYLQYFIGMETFTSDLPFKRSSLNNFRSRINADFLITANELFLANVDENQKEQQAGKKNMKKEPVEETDKPENEGTSILDATCSPSNIKYPQDFQLLNEAREKLEAMIDFFHTTYAPWPKPRTYRRTARKDYLHLAKAKKRTVKAIRSLIRKQLGCLVRDIRYLEAYMGEGYALPSKYINMYLTIRELLKQQQYMFDNKTHRVEHRIVSLSQPYLRPIVRGKAKAPVEFGAKYDVSIDENGHARLEKLSFEPYNESTILKDVLERYKERTGHYPERILVDQIYRTRENRKWCTERGIRMSGPKLGRPAKDHKADPVEKKDNKDRIEVERFFSLEKRCNGAGLIMTKLGHTTLAAIALSVWVTNMFAALKGLFFVLYFMECGQEEPRKHFIMFDEGKDMCWVN